MRYVSIDLETTGLDPAKHQILEIGAAAFDLGHGLVDTFSLIVRHEFLSGTAYALAVNDRLIKAIAGGQGLHLKDALARFSDWLKRHEADGKVVAAGKNFGGFDRLFLEWSGFPVGRFHHRSLDPTVLYLNSGDIVPPSLAVCVERAHVTPRTEHVALEDAITVGELIEARYRG